MRKLSFVLLLLAAGCSEASRPASEAAIVGGDNAYLYQTGAVETNGGGMVLGCHEPGAQLVTTAEGHRSCVNVSGAHLEVGSTDPFDPLVIDRLTQQANQTGQDQAYTNGIYTVTVGPRS